MSATKAMFVWRPPSGTSMASFARSAGDVVAERLGGCGATRVVMHVTEEMPPRFAVVPFRREPLALVAVHGEPASIAHAVGAMRTLPGSIGGYRVDQSVPVERWSDAPGATLLTLFQKNPRLDRDAFFDEWYGTHTPLTLEVHPVQGYVRNAIEETLIDGSPWWDGIVTEDFRERVHLLQARHLFGGTLRALPNMVRVGKHVSKFLDLRTIETYLVTERELVT